MIIMLQGVSYELLSIFLFNQQSQISSAVEVTKGNDNQLYQCTGWKGD